MQAARLDDDDDDDVLNILLNMLYKLNRPFHDALHSSIRRNADRIDEKLIHQALLALGLRYPNLYIYIYIYIEREREREIERDMIGEREREKSMKPNLSDIFLPSTRS